MITGMFVFIGMVPLALLADSYQSDWKIQNTRRRELQKKLVKEEVLFFCIAPACFYDKINYLTLKRKRLVLKLSKVYSRNILFGTISRWMMKLAGKCGFLCINPRTCLRANSKERGTQCEIQKHYGNKASLLSMKTHLSQNIAVSSYRNKGCAFTKISCVTPAKPNADFIFC